MSWLLAFSMDRLAAFLVFFIIMDQRIAFLYVAAEPVPQEAANEHNERNAKLRRQCLIVSHIQSPLIFSNTIPISRQTMHALPTMRINGRERLPLPVLAISRG